MSASGQHMIASDNVDDGEQTTLGVRQGSSFLL